MIRNKKGMSDIVTTLIIIGIALAAVGAIWYVYNNIIKTQTASVTNQSAQVFQSCTEAGLKLMNETGSGSICGGVTTYHGGQKCCSVVPTNP